MMDLSPLTQALVGAAGAAVTALAGVALSRAPLLLTALRVWIDGADATHVRIAIGNAAEVALRAVDGGQPTERAIADMVDYVQGSLPKRVARLRLAAETLETMCGAALARLVAGRG
jgi:hypothetical protein